MRRRWLRILALLSCTTLSAYCGAKGSPQPPLPEAPAAVDGGTPS